jgi:uncharacterized protein (DUF1778 family)
MTAKDERLQIRVDPEQKHLLEEAASLEHLSLSTFVLQAAADWAENVLLERSAVRLSPAAAEAFSLALERPAEVNKRLADALGRPRDFSWID